MLAAVCCNFCVHAICSCMPASPLRRHQRTVPFEYQVVRGLVANIAHAVQVARCIEDQIAWTSMSSKRLDPPRLHQNGNIVIVGVWRITRAYFEPARMNVQFAKPLSPAFENGPN